METKFAPRGVFVETNDDFELCLRERFRSSTEAIETKGFPAVLLDQFPQQETPGIYGKISLVKKDDRRYFVIVKKHAMDCFFTARDYSHAHCIFESLKDQHFLTQMTTHVLESAGPEGRAKAKRVIRDSLNKLNINNSSYLPALSSIAFTLGVELTEERLKTKTD